MNISFSHFCFDFNNSSNQASYSQKNPNQHIQGLLRLLSVALRSSLFAYSKMNFIQSEQILQKNEQSSVIQIEDPNIMQIGSKQAILIQEIKDEKIQRNNSILKEYTHGKSDTQDSQVNQLQNLPLSSNFQKNESVIENDKGLFQNIEVQIDDDNWQRTIQCPQIGITSSSIEKKRLNLLQRQITDWQKDPKTGKKKRQSQIKSRQMRMLFN